MSQPRRRLLLMALLALSILGCEESGPTAELPSMSEVDLAQATGDRVSGALASEAFEAVDVRYRVVDRGGREQLDLLFSEERIERCGLPVERPGRLVWARIPGVTVPEPATYATDAEEHTLSVHYEAPLEERGYDTVGRGSGRLEFIRLEDERLEGRVAICFADPSSSCVRGEFVAYPCYSRIDGRALRESPGLADEALLPPEPETEPRP